MHTAIEFQGVTKVFPGVLALDDVSFTVQGGELVSLMGENGAGKSTLLSILGGEQPPDAGSVLLDGTPVDLSSPITAQRAGIRVIHQEPRFAPGLTVEENILLGHLPNRFGFIHRGDVRQTAAEVCRRLEISLPLDAKAGSIGVAQAQMLEIVKALVFDVKVLALDEPTSSLALTEVEQLFRVLNQLRAEGVTILYVSHRMEEVFALSDGFVVLRDGKLVGTREAAKATEDEIITMMIGRDLENVFPALNPRHGRTALRVENLATAAVGPVSFEVRYGEIVGVAGLVGSGRSRLVRALSGVDRAVSGRMLLDGAAAELRSERDALEKGIAVCPQDRKGLALIPQRSVAENMVLGTPPRRSLFIHPASEDAAVSDYMNKLAVRPPDPRRKVSTLSGGNQQKVVLARSLLRKPRVLILDEPTRGVDVGAKSEIYAVINDLAAQGTAVVVLSSDLIEVLGLSHRVLVMRQGSVAGELPGTAATEESVMKLAVGTTEKNANMKEKA
ncbi:Arabinose import ATP-binding protein AraG [Sinomonas atrocyanea]|uniref:Arabinose import ATP-binding protein AraG n=1 Tax=Sinomonas atrocyanea TaxID=37927 RepID=A0A126ZWV3_9MICC|nr:sugar ABC transporter ATP-binding protein [Sinomonas atrocyanea]AMM31650.1 Arabinose import ATP-binding protein AraG [Sinomonas atrocyanea]GEB64198.1 arabinose import ATP-binding protein AraG [Sinomonas atrocyanea]GGG57144.1 arabinose import ATP-binding protein AraG [Sinomonas atrocyanea]